MRIESTYHEEGFTVDGKILYDMYIAQHIS